MSSTRNNNTTGNYELQQWSLEEQRNNKSYINQPNGKAYTNHFAGDGLLSGRMGSINLSHNYTDIESYLHGTGSTNLVTPNVDPIPEIKPIDSLSIMNKLPVYIPKPLFVEPNQRPQWS